MSYDNLVDKRQLPVPQSTDPNAPEWPAIKELTEPWVTADGNEFPCGGHDLELYDFHVYILSCLHQYLRNCFWAFMEEFRKSPDHYDELVYIGCFVVLSWKSFRFFCDYLISKKIALCDDMPKLYSRLQISKLYFLQARQRETWDKKKTWSDVRGLVAWQNQWGNFWNEQELIVARAQYLINFPDCVYQRFKKTGSNQMVQCVIDLLNSKNDCFNTISKEITPLAWENIKRNSLERGGVDLCPAIFWVWLGMPKTSSLVSTVSRYGWTGCIKFGTISKLLPKLPMTLISKTEMEKFIYKKEKTPVKQMVVELIQKIDECVCTMIVLFMFKFCFVI